MINKLFLDGTIDLHTPLYGGLIPWVTPKMTADFDGEKYCALIWSGSPGIRSNGNYISEPWLNIYFKHEKNCTLSGRIRSFIRDPPKISAFSLITDGKGFKVSLGSDLNVRTELEVEAHLTKKTDYSLTKFIEEWRARY